MKQGSIEPRPSEVRSTPVWRPSASFVVPDRRGVGVARSLPPRDALNLLYAEMTNELARQSEQVAALNARAQRLLRWALRLLALEIVCLFALIVGRLFLG